MKRLRWGDLGRLVLAWLASAIALSIAGALLPGLSATYWWWYLVASAVTAVVGLFVRPLLVAFAARIGWLAVCALAVAGQAVILAISLHITPGIKANDFWTIVLAAWISAMVGTIVSWLSSAGTDDALTSSLIRRRPSSDTISDPEVPGVVFVQLDGVPFPVLHWAVQAGSVPTIREWLLSGRYELREWTPQLPCTTPASQLGILHGTVDRVPAFRWYDRELDRVLVANRPADAAVIESRASNGRGLLADDGVSVSNLFSGDAERSAMTMSRLSVSRGSTVTRRAVAWFLARPDGFARSLTRTIGEIVKERFQARRQRRRNLQPRTHRGWTFAVLRAITNGVLRDLNTAVVSDEMLRGTKVVYVDYVDYDEIAHHAGMFRPESLAALDGVDGVLATLESVAANAPRPYHLVVLSDHGQSQGTSFADRLGYDLASLCAELTTEDVESVDAAVEGWGRAESVVDDLVGTGGVTSRMASRASDRMHDHADEAAGRTGAAEHPSPAPLTVLGSGNLGLLYQSGPQRMTVEEITTRWPRLIPGLATHDGIGLVGALNAAGHPVVFGARGRVDLTDSSCDGDDPLLAYPAHAGRVFARALSMPEAPDLYVVSDVDATTLDVSAFEPLVGSHGGLGGWQDRAVFLCPRELSIDPDEHIEGADHLHRVLVSILKRLGHRRTLVADLATAAEVAE
jgi:uncharacterized membrane protein YvlD (DUF360 family)